MANENIDLQSIYSEIGEVMAKTDLSNVTAQSAGYEDLPDGYYLAEVTDTKIHRSKSSNKPMVSLTFSIVSDGLKLNEDDDASEDVSFSDIPHTKDRLVFKHWVIDSPQNLKKFVSDMKKFEDPSEPNKALLPDEAWSDPAIMGESVPLLAEMNCRMWIHNRVTKKDDGTSSSWQDLVDFNRAAKLGLPVD